LTLLLWKLPIREHSVHNFRKATIQLAPQSASIELQTKNNDGDLNLECVPITAVSMGNVQMTSVVEPMTSNSNTHTLKPTTVVQALDVVTRDLGTHTLEPIRNNPMTTQETQNV